MLNWYLQSGKDSDIVISSRIRFARNLSQFPFIVKADKNAKQKVTEKMKEITPKLGYGLRYINLRDIDEITKNTLVEKHLISPNFIKNNDEYGAMLINDDENISVMINEEDHLRIQVMNSGFDIENLMNLAIEVDEKIGSLVNYAYSEKYGFLTACPTNVGTGLRVSIMVHLPGLARTGNINKVLNVINNFGMNIRGVYGEGSKAEGDMYQISNKQTLGISEKDTVKNLKLITEKIIEQERLARKILAKDSINLEDRVYRAYGILTNAKKISSDEVRNLISEVKLGTDLGIINELDDLKVRKIDLYTKPANLQKYIGKQIGSYERDIKRAEIIKQILNEK
jgi:protein arginine kinase